MNNSINERQNEEESIRYLAAQRQLYSEAKCWNNVLIFTSVIIPILLIILKEFFKMCDIIKFFIYIYPIISLATLHSLNSKISDKKAIAAEIQQYFDIYVFQIKWSNKLFGKKHDLNNDIAKKYQKLLKNNIEKEKLINWYSNIDSNLNLLEAIYIYAKKQIFIGRLI